MIGTKEHYIAENVCLRVTPGEAIRVFQYWILMKLSWQLQLVCRQLTVFLCLCIRRASYTGREGRREFEIREKESLKYGSVLSVENFNRVKSRMFVYRLRYCTLSVCSGNRFLFRLYSPCKQYCRILHAAPLAAAYHRRA
jgi:hypothetical protein